jgi:DNA invertase Pin-like site-specific DNA recombinase
MIQHKFDMSKPHRFVMYGRMSTDMQNPRSPDQQFEEIERLLKRTGHPWIACGRYRDDGVSGRKTKNRPDYLRMINGIKMGRLKIDLILVDTFERFGRMSDVGSIRQELFTTYGVLILTADSQFADPNSVAG